MLTTHRFVTYWMLLSVFACLTLTHVHAASIPPPSGIVAWWPGDGNANDIQGNNNGTLQNGTTFAPGLVLQAFHFNGANNYVSIADTPSMDFGTGNFTIELWVNFDSLGQDQELIQQVIGNGADAPTYFLEYDFTSPHPNTLRFRISNPNSNQNDLFAPVSLVVGQWYHIAAVRQGNTSSLYLNGSLVGSQTAGSNIDTGTGGITTLGALANGGRYLSGSLDEVTLYNRALSVAEIQAIVAAGADGKIKPPAADACPDDVLQAALVPVITTLQAYTQNPAIPARGITELNKEVAALKHAQGLDAAGDLSRTLASIQTALQSMDLVTRNGLNLLPSEITLANVMQTRVQASIDDVAAYVGGNNSRLASANSFMSTGQTQLNANNPLGAANSFKSAQDQVLQAALP